MSDELPLIMGLGNPGRRYAGTRHNVGADAVVCLADMHDEPLRHDAKVHADVVRLRRGAETLAVAAAPTTFMNESGLAASALARRHKLLDPARLVVVHDELDLEPGVVKVKVGGGLAGHKGLQSLRQHLGTADFVRVRIGIGRPPRTGRGADFVLARFSTAERAEIDVAIREAAQAALDVVTEGPEAAMNRWNARR